jgi:hypothetical protein
MSLSLKMEELIFQQSLHNASTSFNAAEIEGEAELSWAPFREFFVKLFKEAVLTGTTEVALVRTPATVVEIVRVGVVA